MVNMFLIAHQDFSEVFVQKKNCYICHCLAIEIEWQYFNGILCFRELQNSVMSCAVIDLNKAFWISPALFFTCLILNHIQLLVNVSANDYVYR